MPSNPQITTAELDFDTLLEAIKSYMSQHEDLLDANFDGSVLAQIADVLAYNTHLLALVANFSLNETFLDSAQLRSSLVSHAKPLGYVPNSKTASLAIIDVAALSVPAATADLTLSALTEFSASIDDETYTFYTLEDYVATEAGDYTFEDVEIYEGTWKTKKFFVDNADDDYPIYVIPDFNIDTDTIVVVVRDGIGSTDLETYVRATAITDLDSDSAVYFLQESPRGYYEIAFGEGISGKRPPVGSIVEVSYLATNDKDANGISSFTTTATVDGFDLSISTITASAGGADRESIESIRFNAPLLRSSQNRLVTVNDFSAFVNNQISNIEALNIWGGEDNDPPNYGHVYIAAKPVGSDGLSAIQKTQLEALIRERSVIDLRPVFVDPSYQYLVVEADVVYDSSKTSLSESQLKTALASVIETYGDDELADFDSVFYLSKLLSDLDDYSNAILGSTATVFFQNRLFPTLNARDSYEFSTVEAIKTPSTSTDSVLTSTGFSTVVNSVTVTAFIRNIPGSTTLEMYYISGSSEVIISNVGSIDSSMGSVSVGPFTPTAYDATKGIQFTITPQSQTAISPLRNLLLRIDTDETAVSVTKGV